MELVSQTAFVNVIEILKDLKAKLIAKPVAFIFDLCNLRSVLLVVFEVFEQLVSGLD